MPEPAPPSRKGRSIPSFSEGVSSPKGQASEDGKICAPCVIRGVRAAKRGPSWQDLRAVRSRKAICGAFRMHGAHILPKPAHFGCMARESCRELAIFPSEATFGIHEAKNCHGLTPGNAPGRNIAIARHPRTHRGATESKDATRTKRRPIQHHALTRPRNHENILVPSAKKRR